MHREAQDLKKQREYTAESRERKAKKRASKENVAQSQIASSSSSSSSSSYKEKNKIEEKNKSQTSSKPLKKSIQPEAIMVAQILSDKITENYPQRTPPTEDQLTEWAVDAERIHRIDGHPWEEITSLLEWSQSDPFWKANILSMGKFRKQWNQLLAKRAQTEGSDNGAGKEPEGWKTLRHWGKRRGILDGK